MGVDADPVLSVARAQNIRFMTVVSLTILIYDWLLLLGDELDFIWKTSSITAKILYLSIRYPTFIDTSLTMVYYFRQHLTTERCLAYDVPSIYILSLGTACTELVLIWRTYILWNQSRKILISLLVMWIIWVCGNLYPVIRFASTIELVPQSIPGVPGCILLNGDPIIFTCYATLLVVEIIIIILTLIKGFRDFRNSQSALVKTLYRDGIVFFIVVTSTSLGNVLTLLIAPIEYTDLLDSFARVIHTVLCCRVVIHLRSAAHRGGATTQATTRPRPTANFLSLRFWHPSEPNGETFDETTTTTDTPMEMSDMSNSTNPETDDSVQEVTRYAGP